MGFHDVQFPARLSFGASGGPKRRVEIVELASGQELRRSAWNASKRQYDASTAVSALSDIYEILAFYEAREGKLFGFRWKDWLDYKSCGFENTPEFSDQLIAYGDNETCDFQIIKSYGDAEHYSYRKITKPIRDSVLVGIEDRECADSEFEIDYENGLVRFAHPPESGAPIYAGYYFDVPVRFDCDFLEINLVNFEAGEIPSIPIVEIFE